MQHVGETVEGLLDHWWVLLVRGIAAVLFAVLAFAWPGVTLAVLVLLFGAYSLVDGVFALWFMVAAARHRRRWWPFLVEGLAGIAVGILTFLWPGITALVLLYLIAAWALVTGVFEIIAAIRLRQAIEGEWLLGLSGVLSIVFGILLVVQPAAGALALIWVIAAYALLFGIVLIVLAFRVRGWRRDFQGTRATA